MDKETETLRNMVLERNQFITTMKSEIYRKEYRNDTEKVDLQTQLIQKEKKVKVLEVRYCSRIIGQYFQHFILIYIYI